MTELERRLEGVPASLKGAMWGPGRREEGGGRRELAARAQALLDEAKSGASSRDDAMKLLAADGLMTLVCELIAEADPSGLASV